jgi:hypothetical protein
MILPCGIGLQGNSPGLLPGLTITYKTYTNKDLTLNGLPWSIVIFSNDRDFTEGNIVTLADPRFSATETFAT